MKAVKRFGNDYYFIGYSPDEIEDYILEHPPNTTRTSQTTWDRSYTICTFKDPNVWKRHWKLFEILKREGL